jgi:endonuclease III
MNFRVQTSAFKVLKVLLEKLRRFYGVLPSPPRDPFRFFVWEALSIHSAPRQRDAAMGAFQRLRALTPDALVRAPQKALEECVALAGAYPDQRLRALRTGAETFRRRRDLPRRIRGALPAARRAVAALPQLGEGSAHRMLLFAGDHPVAPVDATIARVATRLGFGSEHKVFRKTVRGVRAALRAELAPDAQTMRGALVYLSHHGISTCTEGNPHCTICPLMTDCPYGTARVNQLKEATRR